MLANSMVVPPTAPVPGGVATVVVAVARYRTARQGAGHSYSACSLLPSLGVLCGDAPVIAGSHHASPHSQRAPRPVRGARLRAGQRTLPVPGDEPAFSAGRHLRSALALRIISNPQAGDVLARIAGDVCTFTTVMTIAAHRALPDIGLIGGNQMALPLLTQELADVQLDAKLALRDCRERVNRAVAEGEMTATLGREVMAFIARVIELTEAASVVAEEVNRNERVIDAIKRGGLRQPGRRVRLHLSEAGLAVIGCENVTRLHPDEDQAA